MSRTSVIHFNYGKWSVNNPEDEDFVRSYSSKCQICPIMSDSKQCPVPCSIQILGTCQIPSKRRKLYDSSTRNSICITNINDAIDSRGRTQLHVAAANADVELMKKLISRGADPLVKTKSGASALWYAVQSGCVHVAEVLVKHGCSANDKSSDVPFIHTAIENKYPDMVKFLVHNGADVNEFYVVEEKRYTPLKKAVMSGNIKIVQLLLDHGALVDAVDENGETALFEATKRFFRYETIPLLLKYGANVHHKNDSTHSILHCATTYLNDFGVEYAKAIRYLVRNGADINAKTNLNETPLHIAAQRKCTENPCSYMSKSESSGLKNLSFHVSNGIAVLLKYGAKVNIKNVKGETALHLAVKSKCTYLVRNLLYVGAVLYLLYVGDFTCT